MMQPPKPSAHSQSVMKTFKVTVPQATYDALERQAGAVGTVKQLVAPVVIALGAGEIRPRYEYAEVPAAAAPAPTTAIAQRIAGIPKLLAAGRALLVVVCEEFERTGGDRTVATNQELGKVLRYNAAYVGQVVSALETAGWLHVKLYAGGANGRQLWPTEQARRAYGAA